MSDLLAKCDWDEGELHVYIAEWPEVVYVWVDEKTMPYAPVVADVRSLQAENAKLQAEIAELEGTIECLKGLAEANYERCDTCEAMLDCDECLRADASHKELRGLQAENDRLRVELTDLRLKSCPSCGIKVENEKLRNENARMRSCLSDDVDNARQIMGENKKLREQGERLFDKTLELGTENAKLRELCRHLYACNQYCDRENSGGGCSACPYQPLECDCGFEERLLELGIEVKS